MSKLLIDEQPLVVLPKLASKIGLNEAIFLQQVHYWLNSTISTTISDRQWVKNTQDQWAANFPFWSKRTVRRVIESLQERDLIFVTNEHNRNKTDKTDWYSINYDMLEIISNTDTGTMSPSCPVPCVQNGHMDVDNLATSNISIIPKETNIETNTEKRADRSPSSDRLLSGNVNSPSSSKEKRKVALQSCDKYYEYMEIRAVLDKPTEDWTATDFLKYFFCSVAKAHGRPRSFPIWAKDAKLMKIYMDKYGNVNLRKVVKTLCFSREEVEKACRRTIVLSMAVLATQWIMDQVELIAFGTSETVRSASSNLTVEEIRSHESAEERASKLREQRAMENGNGE